MKYKRPYSNNKIKLHRLANSMSNLMRNFSASLRQIWFGRSLESIGEGQNVLDSDRQARRLGYAIVLVVFGGFGGWAALAPLESAAHGQGTVQVEGNRQPVQHLEGGMVAEILVANGEYVNQGQALVLMDATDAQAELSIVSGRLWAKRALVDRLLSERDEKDAVTFADWLLELNDARAVVAIDNERALFAARRADLLGEKGVLLQKIEQTSSEIEGIRAVLNAKRAVAQSYDSEAEELEELLADGYVDKQRIRELERARAATLGEIASMVTRITSAEVFIEENKLKILQLEKRFKTQVVDALTRGDEELYDHQQRYKALRGRLDRTVIRAPADGVILALKPNTIGAVVGSGEELMSIVPDTNTLLIDTKLSPMDIDRIHIGQAAEVRFSVFKDAYSITGTLTKVSADSLLDKASGQRYFEAKVSLMEEDMKLLGDYRLVPGMPAEVLVKTGKRTLLGYLTSPLHRMFENSLIEG
jgi:epimerase transport system membrane fusion protein